MARNVEIKARAFDLERQAALAEALADGPAETLVQRDVFFHCDQGRMKLRFEAPGRGYLVCYSRPDAQGPKTSSYQLFHTHEAEQLERCLSASLRVRGVVEKERILYMIGQTRVHLDRVKGLGDFLELEVVLRSDQDELEGQNIARDLMARLEIGEDALIDRAYMDLLEDT